MANRSTFYKLIFLWIVPFLIPLELWALLYGNPEKSKIPPVVVSGSIFYAAYLAGILVYHLKKPISILSWRRLSQNARMLIALGLILFFVILVLPFVFL